MLASDIIKPGMPHLLLTDKVSLALQLMDDNDVQHLPVLTEDKYAGLLNKNDIETVKKSTLLTALKQDLIHLSVYRSQHFLTVIKLAAENNLSLVPVINEENELQGSVPYSQMIQILVQFVSAEDPGGIIVIETEKHNYSFGELSRLVETNDAYITQLNTSINVITGMLTITLKINKTEISDIISTLQRYDYSIKYYFGEEHYENELKENYNLLMTYLRM